MFPPIISSTYLWLFIMTEVMDYIREAGTNRNTFGAKTKIFRFN